MMEFLKCLSVLYVEDDNLQRELFVSTTEGWFGELRVAESGEKALQIFREHGCDLLITDVVMPEMDGLALCRAIRSISADLAIVVVSAVLSRNILLECVNIGVDGYILKPFEPETVSSVVAQAANRIRLREQSLRDARLWQQTFDSVPDMVAVLDSDCRVLRLNRSAMERLGVTEKEVFGKEYCRLLHKREHRRFRSLFERVVRSGAGYESDMPMHMLGGDFHVTLSPMKDIRGNITGAVHVARDVTELKRAEDALRYASTHDSLTRVYNRAWFDAELERISRGRIRPVSIMVADVDGLKQVNDRFGHKAGDKLLVRAAELIAGCCRADDGIARVGGDEFMVLFPGMNEKDAAEMLNRINLSMEREASEHGSAAVSVSVGIATASEPPGLNEAIVTADRLMYENKEARRRRRAILGAGDADYRSLWEKHSCPFDLSIA